MAQEVPVGADGTTFVDVADKSYRDQAIFWLNAMWPEHSGDAEEVWGLFTIIAEVDKTDKQDKNKKKGVGANGRDLHRLAGCRFFEQDGRALTPIEFKKRLVSDIDKTGSGRLTLIEYLLDKFQTDINVLMIRPQGVVEDDHELMDALAAVQEIEDKKSSLAAKIEDPSTSVVKKNRFKVELEMVKNSADAGKIGLTRAILTAKAKQRKRAKNTEAAPGQGLTWWSSREIAEAEGYKPKGDADKVKQKTFNDEIKKSAAQKAKLDKFDAISKAGREKIVKNEKKRASGIAARAAMFQKPADDEKTAVAQTEAADDAAQEED